MDNNASIHAVPGSSDDAMINVGGNPIIAFNGTSTVHSLVDKDSLNISGGTLTLTSGASQVTGNLTVGPGATLTINGAGATFADGAATTIDGANLLTYNGASLTLSKATTYTGTTNGPTIQTYGTSGPGGTGTPSQISLPNLTTLNGSPPYATTRVYAEAGGIVSLPALTSATKGSTYYYATGAGSLVTIPLLTSIASDSYYNSTLRAEAGGTIADPLLTTLARTDLMVDSSTAISTAQISSYTGATITVDGGSPDFSGLASIDGDSVYANSGATLTFANVASYTGITNDTYVEASGTSGAGGTGTPSRISLPNLATLNGAPPYANTRVYAESGGVVSLPALTSAPTGAIYFYATGAGSLVSMPLLTSIAGNSYYNSTLEASNGGSILTPALTTLSRADLHLDDNLSSISTSVIATITASDLYAAGGADLAFPVLTSYSNPANSATIQANGAGTILDLTHLTTFSGGAPGLGNNGSVLNVNAQAGGRVALGNVAGYTGGSADFHADGASSVIDLSKLPSLFSDAYYNSTLEASNGGSILAPALAAITRVELRLDDNLSSISTSAIASITASDLYAAGGADLAFPVLTSYSNPANSATIQANGAGTILDLTRLTGLAGGAPGLGGNGSVLDINAQAGGEVALGNVVTYTGGSTNFHADGTNSTIFLNDLQRIFSDAYYNSVIQASNGGTITLNAGTVTLSRVDVQVVSSGTIVGGTLQMSGGTLSGNSTIQANVFNSGSTSPGVNNAGMLSIKGNFNQTSTGALNIAIGGTTAGTQYDQLAVTGSVALAGVLNLSTFNGFSASNGNQFVIVTGASRTGLFSSVTGQTAGNGQFFSPIFNPTNVTLLAANANSLRVTSQVPSSYANTAIKTITLNFTEALNSNDAKNASLYTLVDYGVNGVPGVSQGTTIAVTPSYTANSTVVTLTVPALADGTYQLTLSSTIHAANGSLLDGVGNGAGGTPYVTTFVVDTATPTVASETIAANQIQVTYSDPVGMDLASVTNVANYTLAASGGTGLFPNAKNVNVSADIAYVSYNPATEVATLNFIAALPDDAYQLTINGHAGVVDPAGNKLNGGTDSVKVLLLNLIAPTVSLILDPSSDSGASNSDRLTNVTKPTFDVAVNQAGSIELDVDGKAVTTRAVASAGTAPISLTTALTGGNHTIKAIFTPTIGSAVNSSTSITIDTTSPQITTAIPSGTIGTPVAEVDVTFSKLINLATLTASDVTLTGPGGSIAIGSPTLISGDTYRIPFATQRAGGTYTLVIAPQVADLAGNLLPSSFTDTFTIQFPDLAPSNVVAPATASPGQAVLVSWTDTNSGGVNAVGPWVDEVFLSYDGTVANAVPVGSITVNSLAAGQSTPEQATVTIPTTGPASSGTPKFLIFVNPGHSPFELDTANNAAFAGGPTLIPLALTLSFPVSSIAENAANPTILGSVMRNGPTTSPLIVTLQSGDPTKFSLPATVMIPAGQSSATVPLTVMDDGIVEGNIAVPISASASGFVGSRQSITDINTDQAGLMLTIPNPSTPIPKGGFDIATLTRTGPTDQALTVSLATNNPDRFYAPPNVTIPAGQTSTTFALRAIDDDLIEGTQMYAVTASAAGLGSSTLDFSISDTDIPNLSLVLARTTILETDGSTATTGTVTTSFISDQPIVVALSVPVGAAVVVPATVTIPANESSASFAIGAVDQHIVSGITMAVITASVTTTATGVPLAQGSTTATISVIDDEGPALQVVLSTPDVIQGLSPAATGTVIRTGGTTGALVVNLSTSNPTEATVPASVTIPDGRTSATFPINTPPNTLNRGAVTVTITATASGPSPGIASLIISDSALPDLVVSSVSAPASITNDLQKPYNISFTVTNQGTANAVGPWQEELKCAPEFGHGNGGAYRTCTHAPAEHFSRYSLANSSGVR